MKKNNNEKLSIVIGLHPDDYKINDTRVMKPRCGQKFNGTEITGSMLLQDLDHIEFSKSRKIDYFTPNNIAIMISISKKSLEEARSIFSSFIANYGYEMDITKLKSKKEDLFINSSKIYEYFECVQTALVFSYTTIEAFTNLSIPDNYEYSLTNNKNIIETYNKESIERWLPLKVKINDVLPDIYKTSKPNQQKWWSEFIKLENARNDIIHQKSINHTEFYKKYFKSDFLKICEVPEDIIEFFRKALHKNNITNPIWPFTDKDHSIPVNKSFQGENIEVIGNIYEGIKSK